MYVDDSNAYCSRDEDNIQATITERIPLDAPPCEKDGYVYVPLRFTAELIGYKVAWNAANATVYVDGNFRVGSSFLGNSLSIPERGETVYAPPPFESHSGDQGYFFKLTDDYILQMTYLHQEAQRSLFGVIDYEADSDGEATLYSVFFFDDDSDNLGEGFLKLVFNSPDEALRFSHKLTSPYSGYIIIDNVIYWDIMAAQHGRNTDERSDSEVFVSK